MRQVALITTAALAVLAAGCASRPARPQPLPDGATLAARGIECHKERATGSLITATVCTTAAERARQASDAQQTKDWMSKPSGGPCGPAEGCH